MGRDKGAIQWHGREQRYYMAEMLRDVCSRVFISCREEQKNEIDARFDTITDNVEGTGPIVAILSAFNKYPDVAWLVVACDLPLLNMDTIHHLIGHRDRRAFATTFRSPFDNLPEPLVAIWEPVSCALLRAQVAEGLRCPRKALIRNPGNVVILAPPDPDVLLNTNTPGDVDRVLEILDQIKPIE